MTKGLHATMRHARTIVLCAGALLVASGRAHAQDLSVPAAPDIRSVVESPDDGEMAAGPPGMTLSVVTRTPGVPVVLHALRWTDTRPVAVVVVENTSARLLTGLVVSVTWTPAEGPARRRVVSLAVAIAPGETRRVTLGDSEAAQRLAGAQGVIEVAPAGARAADGTTWQQSPGPVWATGATAVACADADWEAQLTGTDLPDAITGSIVRCEADGRWLALDVEGPKP